MRRSTTVAAALLVAACAQPNRLERLAARAPTCPPVVLSTANALLAEKDIPLRFSDEPLAVDIDRIWFTDDGPWEVRRFCIAESAVDARHSAVAFPIIEKDTQISDDGFFVAKVRRDDPRIAGIMNQATGADTYQKKIFQKTYNIYSPDTPDFKRIEIAESLPISNSMQSVLRGITFYSQTTGSRISGFLVRVAGVETALLFMENETSFILIGTPFVGFYARPDEKPAQAVYTATELLEMIVRRAFPAP